MEKTRNAKRPDLLDAQNAIDVQREELIASIEKQLRQQITTEQLFEVRWKLA
ncbi:MAG: hypothetical protein IMZ62_04400 [Chloroflexi bacterium]|nr:hypothetical protein [Chloroflexota bacterium]